MNKAFRVQLSTPLVTPTETGCKVLGVKQFARVLSTEHELFCFVSHLISNLGLSEYSGNQ